MSEHHIKANNGDTPKTLEGIAEYLREALPETESMQIPLLDKAQVRRLRGYAEQLDIEARRIRERRPEAKVFVKMFGGVVDVVRTDSSIVNITDVVFTENRKYASADEEEYYVKDTDGEDTDDFIYSHFGGVEPLDDDVVEQIMEAATRRSQEPT